MGFLLIIKACWLHLVLVLLGFSAVVYTSAFAATTRTTQQQRQRRKIKAAVLVPGFLTGADEFRPLVDALNARGIPTVAVPMPNWHWLPCLGGRSVRPILERLDCTVRWLAANADRMDISDSDSLQISIPKLFEYNWLDAYYDFRDNPGGIFKVGGTDQVAEYPVVEPRGTFLRSDGDDDDSATGSIALIGHSAGGWISRIYLSNRNYGGRVYGGHELVHSLVTLGTPHITVPNSFAFSSLAWCNEEPAETLPNNSRQLAVGGTGFLGGEWGAFTKGSYAFCCAEGSDGTSYDGDGVTPIQSALALPGAEQLKLDGNVHHFCWSDVFGGNFVAPELTEHHKQGGLWYGSESVLDQWASWLEDI